MLPSDGGSTPGSSYRADPDAVQAVLVEVRREPIRTDRLGTALDDALQSLRTDDDPGTTQIIYLLSGIEGDLRAAPVRIEARIGAAAHAGSTVLTAIEVGDDAMAERIASAAGRPGTR